MAKLGEDRYYKRSGTGFYKMEHFDVADMFGRRRKPLLDLVIRVVMGSGGPELVLGLRNSGRGTARAPFLAFGLKTGGMARAAYGLDGNGREGMKPLPHTGEDLPYRYGDDSSSVIHPGVTREVTKVARPMFNTTTPVPASVVIEYEVCAEDVLLTRKVPTVIVEM